MNLFDIPLSLLRIRLRELTQFPLLVHNVALGNFLLPSSQPCLRRS